VWDRPHVGDPRVGFDRAVKTAAEKRAAQTQQMCSQRVWATPEAVDAIVALHAQLGNLVLRHVAGTEGAPEVRLVSSSIPRGPDDIALGTVGGVLFLIDRSHDLALDCPDFQVDVTPTKVHNDDHGVRAQYHLVSRAVPRD
jgi:uncharacterized protein (DUF779 family)